MTDSFLCLNFLLDIHVQLHLQGQLTPPPVKRVVLLSVTTGRMPVTVGGVCDWTCADACAVMKIS